MSVERADIVSYLIQQLDRKDLDEEEFNDRLQAVGIEPPAESARIGKPVHGFDLPPDRKGEAAE